MELTDEVVQLVANVSGVRPSEITPVTEIWNDLRIGGDDLDELLLSFQQRFGVEMQGVDLRIYAPDELGTSLCIAWDWVAPKLHLKKATFPSLTVADLIAAAQSKTWTTRR